jgi:hypothetical protein
MKSAIAQPELYGEFDETLPPSQEYLRIQFSPSSIPLKQRWRNNGLSASFMADFLITFFPNQNGGIDVENRKAEIQGMISYISNELLENAMKFTDDSVQKPVSITLYLLSDRLVFLSTNSVSSASGDRLKRFIDQFTHADPNQLYLEQLEKSALDEDTSAGLGILTMTNDYLAKVGWKLEDISESPRNITVTTMVQLVL